MDGWRRISTYINTRISIYISTQVYVYIYNMLEKCKLAPWSLHMCLREPEFNVCSVQQHVSMIFQLMHSVTFASMPAAFNARTS